ncbi:hypothetical protein [Bradyrhizobium sp. Ce-3]|uniref:hypothetical protein n=1 Tax=Bradyrhizobium sp. Ce-3 TaxID=2913970 RepID=UPI001FB8CF3A|nr:hypothetical protein [Bradyrhizobium sp. Ce-3]GKQ51157.1 hypothetical protein BRSPCE3_20120 [Bradyrhizobium sp. Ce-3]
MPLHRDIHWLGRQWAVTGHGLQLINQKQMGYYDIEAARLWDARVTEVQSKAWIDRPDFDKALELARGKFAQLAPADLPPPAMVAPPPPPVRATSPAAPRAPPDATSVPSIEELLARLKSRSAAAAPIANPAEAPAPVPPAQAKAEPLQAEAGKSEVAKSEPPKAAEPELRQSASVTAEAPVELKPAKPELAKPEPAKSEPAEAESAHRQAPKPESPKVGPLRSEAPESEAPKADVPKLAASSSEAHPAAPVKKLEAPPLTPVITVVRRPARTAWPVFERKIAGSGRFVRPWRVTSGRWHGPSLPPRP